jgi:phospholipase/carboxylesterase
MMTDLAIHPYVFEPAASASPSARTLVLLHGTGGNEHDLLPLGRKVLPGAAILSPRGNVLENGMPRFFRRFAEGIFDLEDVAFRARELARWLRAAIVHHHIDPAQMSVLGYSNGANIAAALMLLEPDVITDAVLLRAMVTIEPPPAPAPPPTSALIISGEQDPIIPIQNATRLATLFTHRGTSVSHQILPTGHQLTHQDLALAQQWLNRST